MDKKEIGKNIKFIRKKNKITRDELAKKLNVSYSSIEKHEQGLREFKIETINKFANALEVPVTDLLGLEKLGTSDTYVNDEGKVAHVFSQKAFDETGFGTEDIPTVKLIIAYIGRMANDKNLPFLDDCQTIIDDVDKIINADLEREKLLLGTKID